MNFYRGSYSLSNIRPKSLTLRRGSEVSPGRMSQSVMDLSPPACALPQRIVLTAAPPVHKSCRKPYVSPVKAGLLLPGTRFKPCRGGSVELPL